MRGRKIAGEIIGKKHVPIEWLVCWGLRETFDSDILKTTFVSLPTKMQLWSDQVGGSVNKI